MFSANSSVVYIFQPFLKMVAARSLLKLNLCPWATCMVLRLHFDREISYCQCWGPQYQTQWCWCQILNGFQSELHFLIYPTEAWFSLLCLPIFSRLRNIIKAIIILTIKRTHIFMWLVAIFNSKMYVSFDSKKVTTDTMMMKWF